MPRLDRVRWEQGWGWDGVGVGMGSDFIRRDVGEVEAANTKVIEQERRRGDKHALLVHRAIPGMMTLKVVA